MDDTAYEQLFMPAAQGQAGMRTIAKLIGALQTELLAQGFSPSEALTICLKWMETYPSWVAAQAMGDALEKAA